MKKYIRNSKTNDRYYVREIWTRPSPDWKSGKSGESYGYLSDRGTWYEFKYYAMPLSYDAARARARRLNQKNTDPSLRYDIESEWGDEE